jgi:RNA polymerase I-specific transcription initiation factor RRN5
MEEVEGLNDIGFDIQHVDEDSGSAYEEPSSDADPSSSQDDRPLESRPPSTTPKRERGRSRSRKARNRTGEQGDSPTEQSTSPQTDHSIRASALQWAAEFKEPQSPGDIKSPTRHAAGTQSKRKAERPCSEIRAKRLKGFYNNDYRELLNAEIHEVAARAVPNEYKSLPKGQIGSSIWTGEEKDTFFSELSKLGRHNALRIALRIGSKSEFEVQEYIHVLQQGMREKEHVRQPLYSLTDLPAAFEISKECCGALERTADVLSSRQECLEEEKERAKWGDFWLLTTDICKSIEKQRKEDGDENIENSLSAVHLLDPRHWLELSQRIFMNSTDPREDNWQLLAEEGESPAIRATAFDDFQSLAVSISKRLISTTLFCTMSRRRATHSAGAKNAEVNLDDVEAALRILGLKENSHEFWIGSARRCHLNVYDIDEDTGREIDLTYDEVETALRRTRRVPRSRSRSMSRQPLSRLPVSSVDDGTDRDNPADSISESPQTDSDCVYGQESDLISQPSLEDDASDLSEGQVITRNSRLEEAMKMKAEEIKESRRVQEAYIEAFDREANKMEEERLWRLLRQTPPVEIKLEPLQMPDRLKHSKSDVGGVDWKDNMEYWSSWETLQTPIPEEMFVSNRKKMTAKARRRLQEESSRPSLSTPTHATDEEEEVSAEDSASDDVSSHFNEEQEVYDNTEERKGLRPHGLDADAPMNDDDDIDIHSTSQNEDDSSQPQSPMSDQAFSSYFPEPAHRDQMSDEEIAMRSDYED